MKTVMCVIAVLVVAAGLAGAACVPAVTPASPPAPEKKAPTADTTFQQDWNKLVAEARKEGTVMIGSSMGPTVRDALNKAFKAKYGIGLEFVSGKPEEIVPKILAERRSGIYSADMFIGGHSVVANLGPEGALESLDKVLVLPEAMDRKAWWGGDLAWIDPSHFQMMFLAFPSQVLWVNADLVRAGEIKSYYDLLNPKWKGKISFRDPTMSGSGNGFVTFVGEMLPNGLDYLRNLAKQGPAFTRDARLQTEWVARGKYPVAIGLKIEITTEFIKAGAPIRPDPAAEGTYVGGEGGGVAMLNRAPQPKATALFINWLLSREGQIIASQAFGAQSAREDVPTDFLQPYEVRQPGVKYHDQLRGLEITKIKRQYQTVAAEIYRDLLK
ncbi:MAG: extracellular solute-binding protein [Chloroflexi bacterium]|nr:extracellular solute-binding protein [Chloroflexota bacterium]